MAGPVHPGLAAASASQKRRRALSMPTFVCELPLRVNRAQERILVARLEVARQVYNACLGEARTRVRLVCESKAFQHARTLPRAHPARKALFAQARVQHAFSEYALHAYVQAIGHA